MRIKKIRKKIQEITEFLNDRTRIDKLRGEGISADGIKARLLEKDRPKIAELRILEKKLELHEPLHKKWWGQVIIGVIILIIAAILGLS